MPLISIHKVLHEGELKERLLTTHKVNPFVATAWTRPASVLITNAEGIALTVIREPEAAVGDGENGGAGAAKKELAVTALAWHPTLNLLVIGYSNGKLKLWYMPRVNELGETTEPATVDEETDWMTSYGLLDIAAKVAVAKPVDGAVREHNAQSVLALQWTAHGDYLLSSSEAHTITLWELEAIKRENHNPDGVAKKVHTLSALWSTATAAVVTQIIHTQEALFPVLERTEDCEDTAGVRGQGDDLAQDGISPNTTSKNNNSSNCPDSDGGKGSVSALNNTGVTRQGDEVSFLLLCGTNMVYYVSEEQKVVECVTQEDKIVAALFDPALRLLVTLNSSSIMDIHRFDDDFTATFVFRRKLAMTAAGGGGVNSQPLLVATSATTNTTIDNNNNNMNSPDNKDDFNNSIKNEDDNHAKSSTNTTTTNNKMNGNNPTDASGATTGRGALTSNTLLPSKPHQPIMVWTSPGIIAFANGDDRVRLFDIENERTEMIALPRSGLHITHLAAHVQQGTLTAGTLEGIVAVYQSTLCEGHCSRGVLTNSGAPRSTNKSPSPAAAAPANTVDYPSSSSSPSGLCALDHADLLERWQALALHELGERVDRIVFLAAGGMAVCSGEGSHLQVIYESARYRTWDGMAASTQISSDLVITESVTGCQSLLRSPTRIHGISSAFPYMALWDGSKINLYTINESAGGEYTLVNFVPSTSPAFALHRDGIFYVKGNHIVYATLQLRFITQFSFTESEGVPVLIDTMGDYLVAVSSRNYLKLAHITARDVRALGAARPLNFELASRQAKEGAHAQENNNNINDNNNTNSSSNAISNSSNSVHLTVKPEYRYSNTNTNIRDAGRLVDAAGVGMQHDADANTKPVASCKSRTVIVSARVNAQGRRVALMTRRRGAMATSMDSRIWVYDSDLDRLFSHDFAPAGHVPDAVYWNTPEQQATSIGELEFLLLACETYQLRSGRAWDRGRQNFLQGVGDGTTESVTSPKNTTTPTAAATTGTGNNHNANSTNMSAVRDNINAACATPGQRDDLPETMPDMENFADGAHNTGTNTTYIAATPAGHTTHHAAGGNGNNSEAARRQGSLGATNFLTERAHNIVTLFATRDGLVEHNTVPLKPYQICLAGLTIPDFLLASIKINGNASNPEDYVIEQKRLRDFDGLKSDKDVVVREALMKFSYYSTIGNMDEAYRCIKSIQNPSAWQGLARMCVSTGRLDVAAVCLATTQDGIGARALREAREDYPENKSIQLAILACHLNMMDRCEELLRLAGRYDLITQVLIACGKFEQAQRHTELCDRIHIYPVAYTYAQFMESLQNLEAAIMWFYNAKAIGTDVPRIYYQSGRLQELRYLLLPPLHGSSNSAVVRGHPSQTSIPNNNNITTNTTNNNTTSVNNNNSNSNNNNNSNSVSSSLRADDHNPVAAIAVEVGQENSSNNHTSSNNNSRHGKSHALATQEDVSHESDMDVARATFAELFANQEDLLRWWAQHSERRRDMGETLRCYHAAHDVYNAVRVLCSLSPPRIDAAVEMVNREVSAARARFEKAQQLTRVWCDDRAAAHYPNTGNNNDNNTNNTNNRSSHSACKSSTSHPAASTGNNSSGSSNKNNNASNMRNMNASSHPEDKVRWSRQRVNRYADESTLREVHEPSMELVGAAFFVGRYYESMGDTQRALQYYKYSGSYHSGVRVAQRASLHSTVYSIAKASQEERLQLACGRYLESVQEYGLAVSLYRAVGATQLALQGCIQGGLFDTLHEISTHIADRSTDPAVFLSMARYFESTENFAKAVEMLVFAREYEAAIEMCERHQVILTDSMAETITGGSEGVGGESTRPSTQANINRGNDTYGGGTDSSNGSRTHANTATGEQRLTLIRRVARLAKNQGSWALASKKYTQAGERVKAMKTLLRTGDVAKIIFFANHSRSVEIYTAAANFLQSQAWRSEASIYQAIVRFYTKAKAYDSLDAFYLSAAQLYIDEDRNYREALRVTMEEQRMLERLATTAPTSSLEHAGSAGGSASSRSNAGQQQQQQQQHYAAKLAQASSRVSVLQSVVRAQHIFSTIEDHSPGVASSDRTVKMSEVVALGSDLVKRSRASHPDHNLIEQTIRIGDVLALLARLYYTKYGEPRNAFKVLQSMLKQGVDVRLFVEMSLLERICADAGQSVSDVVQTATPADQRRDSAAADAVDDLGG